jgi:hypothetical protein
MDAENLSPGANGNEHYTNFRVLFNEAREEGKPLYEPGQKVTVVRSNGDVESDWAYAGISFDKESGERVTVSKQDPERGLIIKHIPAKEFIENNPVARQE